MDSVSRAHCHTSVAVKLSSLVRSNIVWNTVTMGKAICKSLDGGLGRSVTCRESKSKPRISSYFSKDKALSFPQRKWFHVINLLPGHLGKWCHVWGSVLVYAAHRAGTQQQLQQGQSL